MKKLFSVVVLALTLLTSYEVTLRAQFPDPEADISVIRIITSGLVAWRIAAPSNVLTVTDNVSTGIAALKLFSNRGGFLVQTGTTAQLQAATPGATGALAFNTSTNMLGISSGTTVGAWIIPLRTNDTAKISLFP